MTSTFPDSNLRYFTARAALNHKTKKPTRIHSVHDKLICGLIKIWLRIPVDNDKLKFKADDKKCYVVYVKRASQPPPMSTTKKGEHHRHAVKSTS